MLPGIDKEPVPVCLIEQNRLAYEFVCGILQKDPSISVVGVEALAGRTNGKSPAPIFVVDNCGLPLPISECLRRLRFQYPQSKYIVLDRDLPKEDLLRLLWLRIDGFLPYGEVPGKLLEAIRSVARGNIWVSRTILLEYVRCQGEAREKNSSHIESMTTREAQILELINRRLSNKEIANFLGIQESTVKFHLSNIYSKRQVSGRYDIISERPHRSDFEDFLLAVTPATSVA